jgi:hypothetical protein
VQQTTPGAARPLHINLQAPLRPYYRTSAAGCLSGEAAQGLPKTVPVVELDTDTLPAKMYQPRAFDACPVVSRGSGAAVPRFIVSHPRKGGFGILMRTSLAYRVPSVISATQMQLRSGKSTCGPI